jgi:hypothetical protein
MSRISNPAKDQRKTLVEWGIERVPADHFLVNGFRYSHLADAVNEARRAEVARELSLALRVSASSIVDEPPQKILM